LGARWERTQVTTGLIRCRVVPVLDQGGPPGRSHRRHGAHASAPAGAPATAAPTPVGWRENMRPRVWPPDIEQSTGFISAAGRPCSRCRDCPGPVRTRQGRL
jgi:hypothetical protein